MSEAGPGAIVSLCSGGLDSVTLATELATENPDADLFLLSIDYGQRHGARELRAARRCAVRLGATHQVADLQDVRELLWSSVLTDDARDVPEGHYADENMKQTVVPNRNMIMLSIAVGYAISVRAEAVYAAMHAGDHPIYPDCRPEFVSAFAHTAELATLGFHVSGFHVSAPYVHLTKAEIALRANDYRVPIHETYSCYNGRETHCGRCATCVERREALFLADVKDRTEYEDDTFWRRAVETA